MTAVLQGLGDKAKEAFNEAKSNVQDAAETVKDKAKDAVGAAQDTAEDVKEGTQDALRSGYVCNPPQWELLHLFIFLTLERSL